MPTPSSPRCFATIIGGVVSEAGGDEVGEAAGVVRGYDGKHGRDGEATRAFVLGGIAPAVLAFLSRRLPFPRIVPLIAEILGRHDPRPLCTLADATTADAWARAEVEKVI